MPGRRSVTLFVATALALVAGGLSTARAATVTTAWAPAATAAIHPGVQTVTEGSGQCTANFVFSGRGNLYLGQSAHCASTGAATDTNGCTATSMPLGTKVGIQGASRPGTLAYSSWLTMQANGEIDEETCRYNDFALVRIDPADHADVNPSMPHWGGPVAVGDATTAGEKVYSYGNSSLRFGIALLRPKGGLSLGTTPGGWGHTVYTLTPGIPGDSGSGFLDGDGHAIGTLSTIAVAPLPLSNGLGDLASELAYANRHGMAVRLVPGTEAFRPGLPIDLGL